MDNASNKKHEAKFMVPDTIDSCQILHCNVGISLTLLKNQYQMWKKMRKNNRF